MTSEARTAEEIMAAVLEAVRVSVGKYLGKPLPSDRAGVRARLREILFDSFPVSTSYANLDEMQREMATEAGICLLEPFICGMPEGYDPRKILGHPSEVALQMLEDRFRDMLDQMPFTLIRYERARRDGELHDWQFKRIDETNAEVSIHPVKPVEFIVVRLGPLDSEESDGE